MQSFEEDARIAGRLLQWALKPGARPAKDPEYRQLIDRYLDRPDFRALAVAVAEGLGLLILDTSRHGMVLAPAEGSPFTLPNAALSTPSAGADDRLIDGLIQAAIAASIFPSSRDLEEDPDRARPPITPGEIGALLEQLCEGLSRGAADADTEGLYEAWRVFRSQAQSARGRRSLERRIERALQLLRAHGCFLAPAGSQQGWQPTRRYQVLVREIAATRLFEEVQRALARRAQELC